MINENKKIKNRKKGRRRDKNEYCNRKVVRGLIFTEKIKINKVF